MIVYYVAGWYKARLSIKGSLDSKKESLSVSVVVAARNEEDNITNLLEHLTNQNYPSDQYEIIIVDDHSEDKTIEKARTFINSRVKVVSLPDGYSGKRDALNYGCLQASGEFILNTDADCWMGPKWMESMIAAKFHFKADLILGPVQFTSSSLSILGAFQDIDMMNMVGISSATTSFGKTQVCNGACMGYYRKTFTHLNVFREGNRKGAGDDMELMLAFRENSDYRIGYALDANAMVYTEAMPTWKLFLQQRLRWASTGGDIKNRSIKMTLILVLLTNILIPAIGISVLFSESFLPLFLVFLGSKMLLDFIFLYGVFDFYKKISYLILYPLIQFLHILYICIIGVGMHFNSFSWKDREIQS